MDKMVRISIVCGDKVTANDEGGGMRIGDGDGKFDLLWDGMPLRNQRVTISVEIR